MDRVRRTFTLDGTPREGENFDTRTGVVFKSGAFIFNGPRDQADNLANYLSTSYGATYADEGAANVSSGDEADGSEVDGGDKGGANPAGGTDPANGVGNVDAATGGAKPQAPEGNGEGAKAVKPASKKA